VSAPAFTVDVGNSSIGVARWAGGEAEFVRHAEPEHAAGTLAGEVAIVSVAPARLTRLLASLPASARPRLLERAPAGLGEPRLVASAGADRLAVALALRPGPAVAVDAGTAVTVELVDAQGRYLGGFIAPGPATAAAGLAAAAPRLPRLPGEPVTLQPGADTLGALSAGLWGQAVGGVDRLVDVALEKLGGRGVRVVATGGWGAAWSRASRLQAVEFDPLLVHRGIVRWAALEHGS
jgi:pantothenate kinase type III